MARRVLLSLLFCISNLVLLAFGQTQTVVPAKAKPMSGYAIMFERMGGYAGWHDRFWIYPDGRIENEGGMVKTITPQSVLAYLQQIEPLLPRRSQKAPMWRNMCSDCYQYRITILVDSCIRSVVFSEPLPTKSDKLAQATQALRDILFGGRF